MKITPFILLIAIGSIFSIGCSSNQSDKQETIKSDTIKPLSVSEKLVLLNNSADSAWHEIVRLDSQKFADIKRLIQEISYCKQYDEKAVTKALKFTEDVYAMRYTQSSLSDSIIDLYDKKTTELINKVRNIKAGTDEIIQHPIAEQLENEIMEADGQLVNYRGRYDILANEFNSFLETNKDTISTNAVTKDFKMKRVFSVPL
jgi:dGTP triphosphohydrolase